MPGHAASRPGTRVAVNPSQPCGQCLLLPGGPCTTSASTCASSAARCAFPMCRAVSARVVTVDATQAVPIADKLTLAEAAMAEPLAVCLHAGKQAGPLLGKRVLVTGCGPIGALMIIAARFGGAAEIVVTDVADAPLAVAQKLGATHAINVATDAAGARSLARRQGHVRRAVRGFRQRRPRCARALDVLRPGAASRAARPRRRDDAADQLHRRQGIAAARHLPLRSRIRARGAS